jgi:hypothetical protein
LALPASAGSSAPAGSVTAQFSETIDGVLVGFSSSDQTKPLVLGPTRSMFPAVGNVVYDFASSATTSNKLTMTFNKPVSLASMQFFLIENPGVTGTLSLQAFSGSTLVGNTSATAGWHPVQTGTSTTYGPSIEALLPPEGTLSFSNNSQFDSLVITAPPGVSFALGNFVVGVPEPTGLTLAAVSMAGVCVSVWRRRRLA